MLVSEERRSCSNSSLGNEGWRSTSAISRGAAPALVSRTRRSETRAGAAPRLMAEVLRQPSFPSDEFEQLRRSSLTSIDTQRSDPSALASLALTRHLNPYPPSHWMYTTSLD